MGPPPIIKVSTAAVAAQPPPTTSDETARLDVTAERCGARVREKCLPIIGFLLANYLARHPGRTNAECPTPCLSPLMGWVGRGTTTKKVSVSNLSDSGCTGSCVDLLRMVLSGVMLTILLCPDKKVMIVTVFFFGLRAMLIFSRRPQYIKNAT